MTFRTAVTRRLKSIEGVARVYERVRGVDRKISVRGTEICFRAGPGEYTETTGVDSSGRYEGPFLDRLALSLASTPNAVFFDVGGGAGLDSLVANAFGAKDIHIFEPNVQALAFIRKNLRRIPHHLV